MSSPAFGPSDKADEGGLIEFDPDWCIAPSETLRNFLSEMVPMPQFHMSIGVLAVAWGGRNNEHHDFAKQRLQEIIDRVPLTEEHYAVASRCTGTPAVLWRNLERNYRVALAAGKQDVSDG